jgi:hypothetical protein
MHALGSWTSSGGAWFRTIKMASEALKRDCHWIYILENANRPSRHFDLNPRGNGVFQPADTTARCIWLPVAEG